ncbi:MAG: hypothetical protein IPM29_00185 [Planctomycetes bacterium]|nr:hypothetical protein [Planctomycetota bacterium]
MNRKILLPLLISGGLLLPAADVVSQSTAADLRQHERLTDAVRDAKLAYDRAMTSARQAMRDANGELRHELSAELLHQKEQLELARSRLLAFCAVHGLPYPDLESEAALEAADQGGDDAGRDTVDGAFDRARALVRESFADEARRIARRLPLPAFRRAPAADSAAEERDDGRDRRRDTTRRPR